ncbi:regulatory protein, FmdB family [Trichinella spiralis]|uniref:regulatory protein, FmdB family n=1 Tax=Trichinella spiralis TaxID=6334 RepID=UPI0001EFDF3D|nr:regulatory protein, FmdB family [Trichinella spiralis]
MWKKGKTFFQPIKRCYFSHCPGCGTSTIPPIQRLYTDQSQYPQKETHIQIKKTTTPSSGGKFSRSNSIFSSVAQFKTLASSSRKCFDGKASSSSSSSSSFCTSARHEAQFATTMPAGIGVVQSRVHIVSSVGNAASPNWPLAGKRACWLGKLEI